MRVDAYKLENGKITEMFISDEIRGIKCQKVKPQTNTKWIEMGVNKDKTHSIKCSVCGVCRKVRGHAKSWNNRQINRFCGYCGTYMWEEGEAE